MIGGKIHGIDACVCGKSAPCGFGDGHGHPTDILCAGYILHLKGLPLCVGSLKCAPSRARVGGMQEQPCASTAMQAKRAGLQRPCPFCPPRHCPWKTAAPLRRFGPRINPALKLQAGQNSFSGGRLWRLHFHLCRSCLHILSRGCRVHAIRRRCLRATPGCAPTGMRHPLATAWS